MEWFWNLVGEKEMYDSDKIEMFWIGLILMIIAAGIIALIIWGIYSYVYDRIDTKRSSEITMTGELVDKKYIGETETSGTGTAVIPNGDGGFGVGIVSTSSSSPEKFLFFIKADQVYKIHVDMQQFYKYGVGDRVKFDLQIGGLSHSILQSHVAE